VSGEVLARTPRLSMLGELDGDRFGYRLDLAARNSRGASRRHDARLVMATAEWALGLALIGRRNAGALFRRMIATSRRPARATVGPAMKAPS